MEAQVELAGGAVGCRSDIVRPARSCSPFSSGSAPRRRAQGEEQRPGAHRLDEAYNIISSMEPGEYQVSTWSSLIGACRLHPNVRLGEVAVERLFELDPDEASHYVLLCNIYSAAGLWEKSQGR